MFKFDDKMPAEVREWVQELMRAFAEAMDVVTVNHPTGFDAENLCDAAVQTFLARQRLPDGQTVDQLEAAAHDEVMVNLVAGNLPTQNMFEVICIAYNTCALMTDVLSIGTARASMAQIEKMARLLEAGKRPKPKAPPIPVPSTRKGFCQEIRKAWGKSRDMRAIHTHDEKVYQVGPNDEIGLALIHCHGERGAGQRYEDFRFLRNQLEVAVNKLSLPSSAVKDSPFHRFALGFICCHTMSHWISNKMSKGLIADVMEGRCKES